MSSHEGYHQTRINGECFLTHRLIWEGANGPIPDGMLVDHRDCNTRNNDPANLRLATHHQNLANTGKRSTNKSGLKGLSWNSHWGYWQGRVGYQGKVHTKSGDLLTVVAWLFTTREELHGEFARHH